MTEWLATGLACAALARIALAVACCPSIMVLNVPVCGKPGHAISLPVKRDRPSGDDQPAGCHAMCGRKLAEPGDDCAE